MNDPPSAPDSMDGLLGQYLEELERAEDTDALVHRWSAAFPDLAAEFRDAARFRPFSNVAAYTPEPPPDALPDFRIIRRIAAGGMGVVYEAEQLSLKRHVAVKVRRGRLSPRAKRRFFREQEVLARLHQTHIVPIHTSGQAGPWQYFAMAYIQGVPLNHLVHSIRERETVHSDGKTPTLAELADEVLKSSHHGDGQSQLSCLKQSVEPSATPGGPVVQPAPVAKEAIVRPLTLSPGYFRSVSQAMMQAAEALQHAHEVGILHRDVKPSNMMVDTHGQCWLIDFGLAYCNDRPGGDDDPVDSSEAYSLLTTRGPLGTPEYMAPEQYDAQATEHSDVWGLGATLYELLTLRRAFHGRSQDKVKEMILHGEPAAIEQFVSNSPKDLVEICRKCLQKGPVKRYSKMGEVAEDLRRWLKGEPTVARPLWVWQRMWMWARRNKGWAATSAIGTIAALTLGVAIIYAQGVAKDAAEARTRAAEEARQSQERETLLQRLQIKLLSSHTNGWSHEAWELGSQAAKIRLTNDLRDPMASTLNGLDVQITKTFLDTRVSSVVFDATGTRLLFGGSTTPRGKRLDDARIYNRATEEFVHSKLPGAGPVAFRPDGSAVQVLAEEEGVLKLWSVEQQKLIRQFRILPPDSKGKAHFGNHLSQVLSHDGILLAASAKFSDESGILVTWNTTTGKIVNRVPAAAEALAISADGKLLAAGDNHGNASVWNLTTSVKLATIENGRLPITSLAFGRDTRRPLGQRHRAGEDLLLAVGDQGGTAKIWDMRKKVPVSTCRSNQLLISGLVFSPDGMTLAVGSHGQSFLFDMATGRSLLEIRAGYSWNGLSFSPDGRELAIFVDPPDAPGKVNILSIDFGRGLETLHGLPAVVARVRFSEDGHLLAALSQNWQLAVWNLSARRLLHIFEVPVGSLTDNVDFAFDHDCRRLAFAGGSHAVLWDLATGEERKQWELPPGLQDQIVFHKSGRLLSLRVETAGKILGPFAGNDPLQHPRVCRIRDLFAADPLKSLHEFPDFNIHVFLSLVTPDGKTYVVQGLGGTPGKALGSTKAWDTLSGKLLWPIPWDGDPNQMDGGLTQDPQGKLLAVMTRLDGARALVDTRTGRLLGSLGIDAGVNSLGPDARYFGTYGGTAGYMLSRRTDTAPLLRIIGEGELTGSCFNTAGTLLAMGNTNGSVTICDMQEVQRRLASVKLGW